MVNYYVNDVEGMAAFYREHFGFVETFRTPVREPPSTSRSPWAPSFWGSRPSRRRAALHQLRVDPGSPRGEIALWTDDVDEAYAALTARGIRSLSPPHNFIGTLRAAWLEDLEGNPIQIVAKLSAGR